MKNHILLSLLLSLILTSCCPKVTPSRSTSDSVRIVEKHIYIETVRIDTVEVEVPAEVREIVTPKDSSHLENSIAFSDAWFIDGLLHHTLSNKPVRLAAPVIVKDTHKETSIDNLRNYSEIQIVPTKMPLTWWQRFWMTSGKIAWGIILGLIAAAVIRRFVKY